MSVNTYRPREAEVKADWIGEAFRIGLRHLEGVGAQNGSYSPAVSAGGLGGDAGLVMLQTDPKESLALALLVALWMSRASRAAVGVPRHPFLVEKLLQLQLKDSGARNLWSGGDTSTISTVSFHTGKFRIRVEKKQR